MNKYNKRDNSIDIARGIAIIGVLYGHALAWQDVHGTMLHSSFWSFHMALFALVSGYFYKERPFLQTIISSLKSLLLPYFVVTFIVLVIDNIGGGNFTNIETIIHQLCVSAYQTITFCRTPPGFWFVLALFNCRIILSLASKIRYKHKYLLLAIFSCIVFFLPIHIERLELSRSFGLMVFVVIGMYAKQFELLNRPVNKLQAIALAIILLFSSCFFIDIWRYNMPLYVLNFFTASIISYAVIYYCKRLNQMQTIVVKPFVNVLSFCGKHSMMVLSFQALLGLRFIQESIHYTCIHNEYIQSVIFIASCSAFTYMLNGIKTLYGKYFEGSIKRTSAIY